MEQTVEFTVKPFIAHDTVKCYGEEYSITYQVAQNLNTVALTEDVDLKPVGRATFVEGVLAADLSNRNSNKGIIDNYGEEYTDLTKYMDELNNQKYSLINFFDERNAEN